MKAAGAKDEDEIWYMDITFPYEVNGRIIRWYTT